MRDPYLLTVEARSRAQRRREAIEDMVIIPMLVVLLLVLFGVAGAL